MSDLFRRLAATVLAILGFASLAAVPVPALAAREAPAIVSSWLEGLLAAGAEQADFGALRQDGTTTTVSDVSIRYSFEWMFEAGSDHAVTATFRATDIVFDRLRETANGYAADRIAFADGTTLTFDFDNATDATNESEQLPAGSEGEFRITEVLNGFEITQAAWARLVVEDQDPSRRATQFLNIVRQILEFEAESMVATSVEARQVQADGMSIEATYRDMRLENMAQGRIARQEVGSYRSVQTMPTGLDGEATRVEASLGRIVARDYDIRPIWRSLIPDAYSAAVPDTMLGHLSGENLKVSTSPGGELVTIDRIDVRDAVVAQTDSKLIALFDRLAAGEDPDDEEIGRALFDYFEAYSLGQFSFEGLTAEVGGIKLAQIGRFQLTDISLRGLGAGLVERLAASDPDSGAIVGVGRFVLADLKLPPLEALIALDDARAEEDLEAVLKALPTLGRIEVNDLTVVDGEHEGTVTLDRFRLLLDKFIGPIPTDLRSDLVALRVPVAFAEEAEARDVLTALGFDELRLDEEFELRWDPVTEELELERATASLENGGKTTLRLTLGGLPRFIFEDPSRAQEAIATLTVKSASVALEDATALPRIIEIQAREAGLSPQTLRSALVDQLRAGLGPLTGTPFGDDLVAAVERFMENPRKLEIRLQPDAPVPVAQLFGMAATAPQLIPQTLNATVSAD